MERFTTIFLYILFLFFTAHSVGLLFFYEWSKYPFFLPSGLTEEYVVTFRERTVMPATFVTIIYFLYRYFSGKNPTSPIWPVYVIFTSWTLCMFIGFFTIEFTITYLMVFIISLFTTLLVRRAHNKRKNEIF